MFIFSGSLDIFEYCTAQQFLTANPNPLRFSLLEISSNLYIICIFIMLSSVVAVFGAPGRDSSKTVVRSS